MFGRSIPILFSGVIGRSHVVTSQDMDSYTVQYSGIIFPLDLDWRDTVQLPHHDTASRQARLVLVMMTAQRILPPLCTLHEHLCAPRSCFQGWSLHTH
jgi:hypothetical protein